jgi:dolichol-phosphate mannosyltransferase
VTASCLRVIVPVFNEGSNFPVLYQRLCSMLPRPWELFVIYDFEEDDTLPVVRPLAADDSAIHLVRNRQPGFVGALCTGFEAAGAGPCLVVMADLSDDLGVVPEMLRQWQHGYSVVCASRYVAGGRHTGGSLVKRSLSRLAGQSFHLLTGIGTHDITNNFRLYDGEFVASQRIDSRAGCEVAIELTVKAFVGGHPITEVPASYQDRVAGTSRFRLWRWLPHYLRWYFWGLCHGLWRGRLWRIPTPRPRPGKIASA